jgi:hypothetical protein
MPFVSSFILLISLILVLDLIVESRVRVWAVSPVKRYKP